jgi:hypothetical protein
MAQTKKIAKFNHLQYTKLLLQNGKNTIKQKGLFIVSEIPLSCNRTIKTDKHYIRYDYYIKSCSVIPTETQLINTFALKRF